MEEMDTKNDFSLPIRLSKETQCSPQSLNHIQTSHSAQTNQQHQVQSRPLIKKSNTRTIANATTQAFMIGDNLQSKMSLYTIKTKFQNFLGTLIRLADDETPKTAFNVKALIQNLIDGVIEPEEFSTQLQKELKSSHQPYLIYFLQKSLPQVRQALISGEMVIEGIRPPPMPASVQSLVPINKEEYFQFDGENFIKIQKEPRENYLKREEMEMQQQVGPVFSTNSLASTQAAVGKLEDFSNEKKNFNRLLRTRLREIRQIRENIKKIAASVTDEKESENPGIEGDERKDIPEKHSVVKRDPEDIKKEFVQVSIRMEQLDNKLNEMKKMLEESGMFMEGHDPHLNRKQTLSEFANSTRDSDRIEERRYFVRKEVSNNRRNNQLRAANLSRGLVMEEDGQEVSESDHTFNLTSLDEALPPVSNRSKKVPRMKRRSLKLQDVVMNSIKDNRIRVAAAALCSLGSIMPLENS